MAGRRHWGVRAGAAVPKPDRSSFTTTPAPRTRNLGAPRAAATLRSPPPAEHKACTVRQSHRGRAPPAGRTEQGRSHSGEMWDLWPLTVQAALLPGNSGGHTAETHPGRVAPPGEPKGCIGASSRRFLVFLSPTVGVANSWEKEGKKKKKVPGQQSLESLC